VINFIYNIFGTSSSQILSILFAPIILRLYSPEDFGEIVTYLLMVTTCVTISSVKVEHFILDAKNIGQQQQFQFFAQLFSVFSSVMFSVIAVGLFGLSLSIAVIFILQIYFATQLRVQQFIFMNEQIYKKVAYMKIVSVISLIAIQIILALCGIFENSLNLILSLAISPFLTAIIMKTNIQPHFSYLHLQNLKEYILEQRNFILTSSISEISNNYLYALPQTLISISYDTKMAGLYEQSNKLLLIPSKFISTAIMEVFYGRSYDELSSKFLLKHLILNVLNALVIFTILYAFIIPNITFFLGSSWSGIGEIAHMILPAIICLFIFSPLSIYHYTMKTTLIDMCINILMIFMIIFSLFISIEVEEFFYFLNISIILGTFTNFCAVLYLVGRVKL
jgi:O-antigen/teichoic acid export membrane protein